ncbi:fasciclin-2-like isoform X2 [Uloborus diversus]|uniref:fasciclin-2-like isoform X2 n=1 Tax=Uloborus diversus TaxID=327109 RepID=UPI00240A0336|nr:fasciclin-2-like isoform X2 [Uloborus diversus]
MMTSLRRIDIIVLIISVFRLVHCQEIEPRLIISPPQSYLSTPAGKPFGLVCSGEPDNEGSFNEMKWYKPNGEIIPEGTPGVKMFGESSLKLSFVNPTVDESGTYRCTGLYSSSKSLEVEVEINFYEDIKFEDCAEVQDLVVGKEGRINCRPIGNPQPAINWEKNKKRVQSERIMVTPSGIVISSVASEDAGLYTVEAFVLATGINKYRNITVNVLTPPKIIELPEDVIAIQGQDKDIFCRADGSEPLIYSWFDPNMRNLSTVEGFKVDGEKLTLYKVDRNAGGEYKCQVNNRAGEDSEIVRVEVQVPPTIVQFDNLTREETKEALFECRAEGVPRPSLSIRRDNSFQPIEDGQEERIEVEEVEENDQKVIRLSISNVKRSDDGLYYCKASNTAGHVERTGHLEVQFRPDMSATPFTTVKAWSANPANLSCIAEANPNATLTWKFQNEPIEFDEQRYKLYGGVSYSNLLVYTDKRAQYEVFGVYTCEARNKFGENSININLEEATAPGQVTQIVFDKVTSTTITFRLMGPGNTGGLPILAYIMKYRLAEEPVERTITIEWSKDSPYILSELKPRAKYHFSVAARNIVGEGTYKTAEYIMPEETVPEPPSIITEPETISDYPDRFEVRWNVPSDNGEPILYFQIRYFKVERDLKGWAQVGKAVDDNVRNWVEKPSYELNGLASDTYYKIEIRATNKIGNSIPESVVIKTRAGETTHDPLSKDGEELNIYIIIAIVLVALLVFLVILDVTCFFRFHCGLLYLMRYKTCGRSSEKMPSAMEDGRACVKEVSTATNGKIKSDIKSPPSPDQLPPPENRDARPVDLIIDENFKNKSPKGSKTSIGKSSPV